MQLQAQAGDALVRVLEAAEQVLANVYPVVCCLWIASRDRKQLLDRLCKN